MTNHPIRIRIGNAYNGADGKFTDSTMTQAAEALQGDHAGGFHRSRNVYVVGTYAEDTHVDAIPHRRREMDYKAGEPVFGLEVEVHGRDISYSGMRDAYVTSASFSGTVAESLYHLQLLTKAINLAELANEQPVCPECQAEIDAHEKRTN